MGSKKSYKGSLKATKTEEGYEIKLNKKPLSGKIISAVVLEPITNHAAHRILKRINKIPDYIKYPPKNITKSKEFIEEEKDFKNLMNKFKTYSEKPVKFKSKLIKLRIISSKKKDDKYLCFCKKI